MDLKEAIQELKKNETFKHILATLLAIGNFLNGKKVCNSVRSVDSFVIAQLFGFLAISHFLNHAQNKVRVSVSI